MSKSISVSIISILISNLFCEIAFAQLASQKTLLEQIELLPVEFREQVLGIPLAARIELDGKLMGDGMILLGAQGEVQLLNFTDEGGGQFTPAERQHWIRALAQPLPLGVCSTSCPADLLALHYSLENSQLTLLSRVAGKKIDANRFHSLPEQGSYGLILSNRLNLVGAEDRPLSGSYALNLQGSVGDWTGQGSIQLAQAEQGGLTVPHLYFERENEGSFFRAGLFSPTGQGLLRQPQTAGARANTTVGVMTGSSDTLRINDARSSQFPVFVTANRQSTVEIYRNGVLLNSQLVPGGLQLVNTKVLPGGIYPVEVRVVEDGQQVSSQEVTIYKPNQWADPAEPWRYSAYAGQQRELGGSSDSQAGEWAYGGSLNYLLHPRAVVGVAMHQIGDQSQFGASLDWDLADAWKLYTNAFHTIGYGNGLDMQAIWRYSNGSVVLNHALKRLDKEAGETLLSNQSAVSVNYNISDKTVMNTRVSHGDAQGGLSADIGLNNRGQLFGFDVNWRLALFDRANANQSRNTGFELGMDLAFAKQGRNYSVNIGAQGNDPRLGASARQSFDDGVLRSISVAANVDQNGLGLSGSTLFEHDLFSGDAYVQGAGGQSLYGGLNLQSTIAIGGGHAAAGGTSDAAFANAGLIVDLESELDTLKLQANGSDGQSALLRPGRNFIPVEAYKSGALQFDFAGTATPSLRLQPSSALYHLNKGGVAHLVIKAIKTVTVLGQLLDASGQPLRGAVVINHAGRSVSEANGFFSLEMSEGTPTIEVQHAAVSNCLFQLDAGSFRREDDSLLVGALRCAA